MKTEKFGCVIEHDLFEFTTTGLAAAVDPLHVSDSKIVLNRHLAELVACINSNSSIVWIETFVTLL